MNTRFSENAKLPSVIFGLGLLEIGRPWGYGNAFVPTERQARALLEFAFELGVRYFDTAPSYGPSEERLGRFLSSLTASQRESITVATKFGEHWNASLRQPFVDHSYDALRRSLDESLRRLGVVDILQLHKTSPDVLRSDDLARALEYASSVGIRTLGASVSDLQSALIVVRRPTFRVLQLPFNIVMDRFEDTIQNASSQGLTVVVNRPFGMGKLLYENNGIRKADAFAFILRRPFKGVILSGTKSQSHLKENWMAFQEALHKTCNGAQ